MTIDTAAPHGAHDHGAHDHGSHGHGADGHGHGASASVHVLDPLRAAEIDTLVAAVRADARIGDAPRFWGAALDEDRARPQRADPGPCASSS
jgi:hypothetical protein